MVMIARQQIMPAGVKQLRELGEAIEAAQDAAGAPCEELQVELVELSEQLGQFRTVAHALADALTGAPEEPDKAGRYYKANVVPLMNDLREIGDALECGVSAEFWPLPTYRELLFIK